MNTLKTVQNKKGLPIWIALSLIGIAAQRDITVDCLDAGGRAKQDARAECYFTLGILPCPIRVVLKHVKICSRQIFRMGLGRSPEPQAIPLPGPVSVDTFPLSGNRFEFQMGSAGQVGPFRYG